jgi:hypothetical protein
MTHNLPDIPRNSILEAELEIEVSRIESHLQEDLEL